MRREMFLIPIVSIGPSMGYLPCLLMRYMKYGAPIMDVIMPEGISVGEMTAFSDCVGEGEKRRACER